MLGVKKLCFQVEEMMDGLMQKIFLRKIKIQRGKPILLNKIDFVMFPAKAIAKLVQKVGEDLGEDYLYGLGYDAGMVVAKDFVKKFNWLERSLATRLFDIFKMFEVMGFGKSDLKVWDSKNNRMLAHVSNHPVLIHSVKLFGKNEKACTFYRGIFSAHADNELGIDGCNFIETQCIRHGSKFCEWSHNYFKKAESKSRKKKR